MDNGSEDSGIQDALQSYPYLKVIRNDVNRGFAGACNQGICASEGDFVLLLNSDAWLDASFLSKALDAFENRPEIGSLTGKIYRAQAPTLDSTGIELAKKKFSPKDRGETEQDRGQYDLEQYVFGASGAAVLYRKAALEDCRVSGEYFDEDFFAYYEDVDLAWRMQILGWRCLYLPSAVAWHDRKGPRIKNRSVFARAFANRYLCYIKNELPGAIPSYLPFALPYELGRCGWLFLRKPYMIASIGSFLSRLPKAWKKRKLIQQRRKVSKDYLAQFE